MPKEKSFHWLILILVVVLLTVTCKTTEKTANYYRPYFDQTKSEYVKTPNAKSAELDTIVMIRSNLRDHLHHFVDTIIISETFFIESGELAVPTALINSKPPKYDTLLVAASYLFSTDFIDVLFPILPDTIADQFFKNSQTDSVENSMNVDSVQTIDSTEQFKIAESRKAFLSVPEILADSTRDLYEADSILHTIIGDAPWQIGDSIPYFKGMNNLFLDSVLMLVFDTLRIRVFDPSDIIPQMSFAVLSNIKTDTIQLADTLFYEDEVTFRIFYPDEIDLFIDMVRVQGGTFKIGSNEFDDDERPEYNLRVSNFLLGKYEITNYHFVFFLNDIECDSLGELDGLKIIDLYHPLTRIERNRFTGKFSVKYGWDDFPVANVTWVGAQMFCKAAGGRLPSEAEWEYAARGGIYAVRYYTDLKKENINYEFRYAGGHYMRELGWFVDNSRGEVSVGGRLKPNELGIYDMCGNLWEWCYDKYNNEFYRQNNRSTDPMSLTGSNIRVNRGGSWSSDAMFCRVTNRNFLNQFQCNPYLGFRLMREWK